MMPKSVPSRLNFSRSALLVYSRASSSRDNGAVRPSIVIVVWKVVVAVQDYDHPGLMAGVTVLRQAPAEDWLFSTTTTTPS